MATKEPKTEFLRLPVVSAGAEYLVMGYLMRRNVLAYKAPMNNEGYDLICSHPDPRHTTPKGQFSRVRAQPSSIPCHTTSISEPMWPPARGRKCTCGT